MKPATTGIWDRVVGHTPVKVFVQVLLLYYRVENFRPGVTWPYIFTCLSAVSHNLLFIVRYSILYYYYVNDVLYAVDDTCVSR